MSEATRESVSRREMLKVTGGAAASASVLAGVTLPNVHAGESNTIQVALVGCGGRGTGAAEQALSVKGQGPIKLVAMADVFPNRLKGSFRELSKTRPIADQIDVPEDRKFIGFDAYKRAIDCLKPNDVVILATPPAFRWPQFTYAIEKNINTFMEKPVTVDGPTSKRMFKLGEQAAAKNLKVGVGLMCRHCEARQQMMDRIQDGEIGDITFLRCYRMHDRIGHAFVGPRPQNGLSELMWQIREFHAFLWASGGCFSDFYIHNIDECCWFKGAWPVKAHATGGRHYKGNDVDQNFDAYSVEYTFEDGTKLFMDGRCMVGCHGEFASYAHGTKGSAVISANAHSPARCRTYKGHNLRGRSNLIWRYPNRREPSPYQLEWDHLIAAIREDTPYNEVERGVKASLVTSMGRMAAHTGRIITYDQILNHDHEFAPDVDKLTMDSPAPIVADSNGEYPTPKPGLYRRYEYRV